MNNYHNITNPFTVICNDTRKIPREEWLLLRKQGIGMSDFPALLGLNGTPMAVFNEKRNPSVEEKDLTLSDLFRLKFGNALESVMHEIMAINLGADAIVDKRMFRSTITPYMLGNIDGLFRLRHDTVIQGVFFPADTLLLFEGKTTNFFLFDKSRQGSLPHHVAQCKAGMIVRGVDAAILVVARGNDLEKDLVYHLIQITREDREIIPMIIHDFWVEHLLTGIAPDIVPGPCATAMKNELLRFYTKTLSDDEGETLLLPRSSHPIIQQALQIRGEIAEMEAILREKKQARDEMDVYLIDHLKDKGRKAVLNCGPRTYTVGYQNTGKKEDITSANMDRLKREMPDIYRNLVDEGIITQPNSKMFYVREQRRRFDVKKGQVMQTA